MRYISYIELRADGLRGNHFHRRKQEWVYVIQGALELIEDRSGTERARDAAISRLAAASPAPVIP